MARAWPFAPGRAGWQGIGKILRPDLFDYLERRVHGPGHGLCDRFGVHKVGGFGGEEGVRGGYMTEGGNKEGGGGVFGNGVRIGR